MKYTAPESMVVYEEDPTAAAGLLNSRTGYVGYRLNRLTGQNNPTVAVNAAAYRPAEWTAFCAASGTAGPGMMPNMISRAGQGAIIFLHQMVSPNGNHRLVAVEYCAEGPFFCGGFIVSFNISETAVTPGTWRTAPSAFVANGEVDVLAGVTRTLPKIRIYAGQIDPNDASHFTFKYEMWGKSDVCDGRLDNNGWITLTMRHRPGWH
jgi:hypothetical protein